MCFYCGQNHKEFVADDDGHDDENMEGVCCIENCARWSYFQYSFHLIDRKENFFFNRHHFFSGWHICTRTVIDLFVFSRLCLYLDLMDLNKMRIFTRTIQTSQIAFYGSFYTNTQQKHFFSFSFKQKPRYNSNKNTRVFSF